MEHNGSVRTDRFSETLSVVLIVCRDVLKNIANSLLGVCLFLIMG